MLILLYTGGGWSSIYKKESNWYNEDGEEQSAGGYSYYAKKLKLCSTDNKILLIEKDFDKVFHKEYSNNRIDLPACFIYKDKYKNWWIQK